MSWSKHFPDFGTMPQPVLDALARGEIRDVSYRNDVCPSFIRSCDWAVVDAAGEVIVPRLWVDYEEPQKREYSEVKRCMVIAADGSTPVAETDDIAEALRTLMAQPKIEGGAL